jgi:hypothetical protein
MRLLLALVVFVSALAFGVGACIGALDRITWDRMCARDYTSACKLYYEGAHAEQGM